jgi:hypothetical protein
MYMQMTFKEHIRCKNILSERLTHHISQHVQQILSNITLAPIIKIEIYGYYKVRGQANVHFSRFYPDYGC